MLSVVSWSLAYFCSCLGQKFASSENPARKPADFVQFQVSPFFLPLDSASGQIEHRLSFQVFQSFCLLHLPTVFFCLLLAIESKTKQKFSLHFFSPYSTFLFWVSFPCNAAHRHIQKAQFLVFPRCTVISLSPISTSVLVLTLFLASFYSCLFKQILCWWLI